MIAIYFDPTRVGKINALRFLWVWLKLGNPVASVGIRSSIVARKNKSGATSAMFGGKQSLFIICSKTVS